MLSARRGPHAVDRYPMSSVPLLQAENISRRYGPLTAVDGVSFTLARGEVLGFLGPNGAGKSTTMQVLTGNLAPSGGRVRVNGIDLLDAPKQAKAHLGYLPEQPPLYPELSVDEYLGFCARLHRLPRGRREPAVSRAKARCGLAQVGKRLIGNLSKGYRQRVGIAQAILHNPAVVILDEPTVGLDPIQIREIRSLVRELAAEHAVILSTHILAEVQAVCDRVQILFRGRLVYSDTLENLARGAQATGSLIAAFHRPPADAELGALAGVEGVQPLPGDARRLRLTVRDAEQAGLALCERAAAEGWGLYELVPERRTLEQLFIDLTTTEGT